MSIKTALYDLLSGSTAVKALTSTRIYPMVAPDSADKPFIVYQRITAEHAHHLADPGGLVSSTFQISIYASSSLSSWNVAEAVRNLLDGYINASGTPVIQSIALQNEIDDYEAPTDASQGGVFSVKQDYGIWYEEATPTNV